METYIQEALYPLYFRKEDALRLGRDIRNRHSVVLIGMKRVGISNFLRFFIYNKAASKTYINDDKKYLFVPVDLNDLIEREIVPFWVLTFKRIVDSVAASSLDDITKEEIEKIFLESIQLNDQFMLIENIRKSLLMIIDKGFLPTIFYLRFDRLQASATENLLANLRGLKDSTHQILSFVFTCYKPLHDVMPKAFHKGLLASFTQEMYLKPANDEDRKIVFDTHLMRYDVKLNPDQQRMLFDCAGGHLRYLQLALIILHELESAPSADNMLEKLTKDERIILQSEELWESLNKTEQSILRKIVSGTDLSGEDLDEGRYLFDTGFIVDKQNKHEVFSPLLTNFIKSRPAEESNGDTSGEFTKKELSLFNFLHDHLGEVCERESIIEAVWTDEEDALEVSDWAMDRLVARVRNKLKKQNGEFEIVTVRTRGYKLITA